MCSASSLVASNATGSSFDNSLSPQSVNFDLVDPVEPVEPVDQLSLSSVNFEPVEPVAC